jgi:aryl-phospho-beta-D-glucosidase BglC (GH1 family)
MFQRQPQTGWRAWPRARTAPARRPLGVEALEDRVVPTTVSYGVDNAWNSGFQAHITILNDTTAPISNWKLDFNYGQQITSLWDGSVVASGQGHYTVENAGWNGTIAPNTSVTVGFTANGAPTPAPSNYEINGLPPGGAAPAPPPTLAVGNTTVSESGSNTTASFQVTLSSASAQAVSVAYATSDGTAKAGVAYTAASGTLTFPAGQTTEIVSVGVTGNPNPAPDETFTLTLSNPSGATVAQATATGTIHDTVTAPPPALSIGSATGTEGGQGGGGVLDFFHTSGNQIVDAYGNDVQIAGVNWFGLETTTFAPHGLDVHSYQWYIDEMKQLGFNTIRLPFSLQTFDPSSVPTGINYTLNPDLAGLTPLGIMDKIIAYAGKDGLRVILDDHRAEAGNGPNADGLWYDSSYSEQQWISTWTILAGHYGNNPTVLGADLLDEPHGPATWGTGSLTTDWRLAAERAGNAILAVNPNWLIFVEGVESGPSGYYWWGGNLSAAGQYPVVLNTPNRLVYSPHDYPSSVYDQTWFNAPNYPSNLPSVWTQNWGYLFINNIAPVWLGEFGTMLQTTSDQQWLGALTNYLAGNMNANGSSVLKPGQTGVSWTYWSWNPDSGDTGGILEDDWTTPIMAKVDALQPIEFTFPTAGGAGTPGTPLTFTVTLSAASATPVTAAYATADGTAKAGVDYTATSGTLSFAPGQTTQSITVGVLNDAALTAGETFSVVLSSPSGATIAQGSGVGTINPATGSTGSPPASSPPSSSPPASSPPAGGSSSGTVSATVSYQVTANWGSGFNENITITNTGPQAISTWTLEFDAPFSITQLWSGVILSNQGNDYVVGPVAYDTAIAPGGSVTFGFSATGSAEGSPDDFKLNGQPV